MSCRSPLSLLFVCALASFTLGVAARPLVELTHSLNERPIIGILTQPGDPAPKQYSYIAASYVKWVESAGARVIPILYDMPEAEIRRRFSAINGVLIPGGGAILSPGHMFFDTARLLMDLAVEANDNGDYFPVHGTCLGMETMCVVLSENYTLLERFDAEDAAAPLLFTANAEGSHLVRSLPQKTVHDLQQSPIAMENHGKGLSMAAYVGSAKLSSFFNVLSLSIDKSGNPYVSTLEAKKYPITATQWHPEKNAYEWTESVHIPHSLDAIAMAQEMANFFVAEARNNLHMASCVAEEDELLIYNWMPRFTGAHSSSGHAEETDFAQAYFFEEWAAPTSPGPCRNKAALKQGAWAAKTIGRRQPASLA